MKRPTIFQIVSILLWVLYSGIYLYGVAYVPYHPDEATQLYMSDDIAAPDPRGGTTSYDRGLRDHYRMIDSPLTHIVIGLERLTTGDTHVRTDWNWSLSWETNRSVGALPSTQTLVNARLALAWLFPLGLFCFYLIVRMLLNDKIALVTSILFGLNSILLVHTRRAMAEGLQLSLILILLYLVLTKNNLIKNILAILAIALLIQTKQLVLPLVAAAFLVLIINKFRSGGWKSAFVWALATFLTVFAFHYLLNPIVRADPIGITIQMFQDRLDFSRRQFTEFSRIGSGLALTTPALRFLGMLAQTFFAPAAYLDTGNYVKNVLPEISRYEANPFNILFTTRWIQILLFILFLAGLVSGIIDWIRTKSEVLLILLLTTVSMIAFYTAIISIGFQRYYIQFLPFVYIWNGYFLHKILTLHPKQIR
jgi:hypothetical protein